MNANLGTSTSERGLEAAYQEFCKLSEEILSLDFVQTIDRKAMEDILSSREFSKEKQKNWLFF